MAIVLDTYPSIITFPKRRPALIFINIPIQAGIGKRTYEPYVPDLFFDQGERLKRQEKWFKELEKEILHGPKLKSDIRKLKDATAKENELIDCWESMQNERPEVFWDRKKDGRHIEPAQMFYCGEHNEKIKIIPAREILDDNYGKNKKRNDTIFEIRCKYLNDYKTGRKNYENLGIYSYESPEAYRQFLEEVENLGLVRKAGELVKIGGEEIEAKQFIVADADTDLHYSLKDLDTCQKEKILD
jgi:hypothetical protein